MAGRPWTADEMRVVCREYHNSATAAEIAKKLRRSKSAVHQMATRLRLTKPRQLTEAVDSALRNRPDEWSDQDIADAVGVSRSCVSRRRRCLGLPAPGFTKRSRQKLKDAYLREMRRKGLRSLAELANQIRIERAKPHAWPDGLRAREYEILNLLWERGPMTRVQLAEAMGMKTEGRRSNQLLKGFPNSYLGELRKAGLVVQVGRFGGGRGLGGGTAVYSLPMDIERKETA